MDRNPGLSVRLKLTLSYAGFLLVAGVLFLAAAWIFLNAERHPGLIFLPGYKTTLVTEFLPTALLVIGGLAVFGLIGGWFLAGRMLSPLRRITAATRLAATGSLSHRIELPGRDDEFRELADAFDSMLGRLEAHVAEQQRFAANASHELRTPLAITQTMLDVARRDPTADRPELLDRLHQVNARAIELTEALLLLSRADQRAFAVEQVDLSLLAEQAAETLLALAERREISLEIAGEAAVTVGSPALLLQLTTNLMHNAIVHNLGPGGSVWCRTKLDLETVLLEVENTGARISPSAASTLTEPFLRGTERLHTDHAGVGLGLAIVDRITTAHGGALTLTPREAGGLCVAVRLPRADGPAR